MELHLEVALLRYFQQAAISAARAPSEAPPSCDDEDGPLSMDAIAIDDDIPEEPPTRVAATATVLPSRPAPSERRHGKALTLRIAFSLSATVVLLAGVLGAGLAYFVFHGVSSARPSSTPIEAAAGLEPESWGLDWPSRSSTRIPQ